MRRKTGKRVALLCAFMVFLILMIYGGLRILETAVFSDEGQEVIETKAFIRDGVKYFPRSDICVVMLLGVDKEGKVVEEQMNHGNAVDMITLMVFDERDEVVNLLCINRDTMVEMPRLNEYGRVTGWRVAQLALSHTYGNGLEDSCVNTRTAVSNLLRGLPVDYYFSMNMDAVSILNDAVGGVAVTVRDDFSQVDPSIQMGEMKLMGQQALVYVQTRKDVGDQLALSRVERQKEYMRGFVTALAEKASQSSTFMLKTYDAITDYIVTDMSSKTVSKLMDKYQSYILEEAYTLQGENVLGQTYYEYYPDEDALEELLIRLCFEAKE